MKTKLLFITIAALSCQLMGGELSLHNCYDKAEKTHPLQQEWQNRQMIYHLNRKNLTVKWLPDLNVNARATYSSDVASFDNILGTLPIPISADALPNTPKDQYKFTIDISQTLFDGGAVHAAKKMEQSALRVDLQAIQTEFYKVHDQVNQVYFASLMLQKQTELAKIYKNELQERRAALESGVQNGVILPSNVDVLDAEGLKIDQQIAELSIQQNRTKKILSELIDEDVSDCVLFLPEVHMPADSTIARPEIYLFENQKEVLEMNKKVIQTEQIPKAAAFISYGYGQPPGNDFFNDQFDTYYTVGVAVSWNIFNWNTTKRNKQILQVKQKIVDAKEENFKKQIRIALNSSLAEVDRLKMLLDSDKKLISLREKIKNAATSKLNNGTISSTEFLTELNAEREARINYEMHKVQLVQAKVGYRTLSGQINLKSEK